MVNLNTHGRCLRPNLFSELALKVFPRLSGALKGGLMATLFLCCFSPGTLLGQCNIAYTSPPMPGDPGEINLSLGFTGNVTLNSNVFIGQVSSPNCPGGTIELWQNSLGTIPYSPTNFSCADEGTVVTVWVSIEGPLSQSNAIEFDVTIVDDVAPVVTWPANVNMTATAGQCAQNVISLTPSVTDNCPGSYLVSWVRSPVSGNPTPGMGLTTANGTYNVGVTNVNFTLTDLNTGNTFMHTTVVTITDNQPPTYVSTISNATLSANGGPAPGCTADRTWTHPFNSDNCAVTSYTLELTGATNEFYPNGSFDEGDPITETFNLGTTTCTYRISDGVNPIVPQVFTVTVNDNTDPVFAPAPAIVNVATVTCTAPVTLTRSATDNCDASVGISFTVSPSAGVVLNNPAQNTGDAGGTYPVGVYTIVFTAVDNFSNDTQHTVTLTVSDNIPPVAICADITVQLDANGQVVVDAQQLNNGSTDNCNVVDYFFFTGGFNGVSTLPFDCSDIATSPNAVTIYVTDGTNNSGTCNANVTVEDNVLPTAQCQPVSVSLPPAGTGTITSAQVNNSSFDNCGVMSAIASPLAFTCANVGANTVTLTVTDVNGNVNTCTATVTVMDVTVPDAAGSAYIATLSNTLNGGGTYTVTPANVNAGSSTDNCSVSLVEVSRFRTGPWSAAGAVYNCTDLSLPNPDYIYIRATDPSGNTNVDSVFVTVQDVNAPTFTCPVSDTIYLNAAGTKTLTALDLTYPIPIGSPGQWATDNCSFLSAQLREFPFIGPWQNSINFTCGDVGSNVVRFRATDNSSNLASFCTVNLIVLDTIDPSAACLDISVALNSGGTVNVSGFQVGIASQDNCTGFLFLDREIALDANDDGNPDAPFATDIIFDCDDIKMHNVIMQVTDDSGNSATCEATVTIQDNIDPTISCPRDTSIVWVDGMTLVPSDFGQEVVIFPAIPGIGDGSAADNCYVEVDWSDGPHVPAPNGCDTDGYVFDFERTWTAIDSAGNLTSCIQIVTLIDTLPPTFTAPADRIGANALECPEGYTVADFRCDTWTSLNVPVPISDVLSTTVTSTLTITLPDPTIITDVNVLDLQIAHTWTGDLNISLTSPSGTVVNLINNQCGSDDNININLDDEAGGGFTCPLSLGNTEQPNGSLSDFIGEDMSGIWTLTIFDNANLDGGNLNNWSLGICYIQQEDYATSTSLTGDVTDEDDDCDANPEATYEDFHAYKDFVSHLEGNAYNFSSWTASAPNGGSASGNATTVTLVSDNDGGTVGQANYTLNGGLPATGMVVFDWSYSSANSSPFFDPFGYVLDGTFVQLTDNAGPLAQGGRVLVDVTAVSFAFSQRSTDACCGAATTTITNFAFIDGGFPVPAVDCPRSFCIARLWDLEDDCGNDADTQVQLISTDDTEGPEFDIPLTLTILTGGGGCAPTVDLDFEIDITDGCSFFDVFYTINGGPQIPGADASGNYAPGDYTIVFTAEDECGNTESHTLQLTVVDNQTPFAVCFPAITVQLDNNGMATITPSSINNGSNDNCGLVDVSLSQTNFTTADIGVVPVTLTVEDAEGNTNSCNSLVTVLGGIIFDVQDASGPVGGMASPVVTATDFVQVTSFSMELNIVNTSVAVTTFPTQIGGITGINSALTTGGTFSFVVNSASKVTVNWFCNTPGCSLTLADGAPLFSLKTNLVGALGSSTPVIINNDNVFTVPGGLINPVPSIGLSGTITILGAGTQTITGTLRREANCTSVSGDLINNVQMSLTGTSSTPSSPYLDADGTYSFSVPTGSTATVSPFKNGTTTGLPTPGTWFTGIDILDVIAVNEHFLGINLLTSDYKKVAADANKSGTINVADVFIINQLSLFSIPSGLTTPAWRFADAGFTFPPSAALVVPAFPESTTVNAIAATTTRNFIGVKVGDVNCTASTTLLIGSQSEERSDKLPFLVSDQYLTAGQEVTVAFLAKEFSEMLGYQMTVKFDAHALKYQSFQPGNLVGLSESNLNTGEATNGFIATNWFSFEPVDMEDGTTVFAMTFKATEDGLLSEVLTINSEFIEAMAVKAGGEVLGIDLEFDSPNATGEARNDHFALYQNSPNPFSSRTQIGFRLPQADHAVLTILDPSGRVLKIVENDYSAGYHEVNFERNDLPTSGVMFYQLETSTGRAVRKMVLLD